MLPAGTHYYDPYQATVLGNGTIYYTTDGSTPTLNSNSAINTVQVSIDQNKEIKAFLVDGQEILQLSSLKISHGSYSRLGYLF